MVIALVNAKRLPAHRGTRRDDRFSGHYILLCGMEGHMFMYLDPAGTTSTMGADDFDHARRCPGTDEDLIFIYLDENPGLIQEVLIGPQLGATAAPAMHSDGTAGSS